MVHDRVFRVRGNDDDHNNNENQNDNENENGEEEQDGVHLLADASRYATGSNGSGNGNDATANRPASVGESLPFRVISAEDASRESVFVLCNWLRTDSVKGLSVEEAVRRFGLFGPNILPGDTPIQKSFFQVLLKEMREPMIILLLFVAILYFALEEIGEALFVSIIIGAVICIEVWNERRSKAAVDLLRSTVKPMGIVRRNGALMKVESSEITIGDVLALKAGQRLAADVRLISSSGLEVEESLLTGESEPIPKSASSDATLDALQGYPNGLDSRIDSSFSGYVPRNVLIAGSSVVKGSGVAVVYAIGGSTRVGKLGKSLDDVSKPKKTPLQKVMKKFAFRFSLCAVSFSVIVFFGLLFLTNASWKVALISSLSLAFVTIPEELPLLIKSVMAVGAYALSKSHHIIMKQVQSVEAIASCSVLFSDKTGTLTRNKLSLAKAVTFRKAFDVPEFSVASPRGLNAAASEEIAKSVVIDARVPTGSLLNAWGFLSSDLSYLMALLANEISTRDAQLQDPFDDAVYAALQSTSSPNDVSCDSLLSSLRTVVGTADIPPAVVSQYERLRGKLLAFQDSSPQSPGKSDSETSLSASLLIKGAPEDVVSKCGRLRTESEGDIPLSSHAKALILSYVSSLAGRGFRLIALAQQDTRFPLHLDVRVDNGAFVGSEESVTDFIRDHCQDGSFVFLGFLMFEDPLREDAAEAVDWIRSAGIHVVVVSGDHSRTVQSVLGTLVKQPERHADLSVLTEAGIGPFVLDCFSVLQSYSTHSGDTEMSFSTFLSDYLSQVVNALKDRVSGSLHQVTNGKGAIVGVARATPDVKLSLLRMLRDGQHRVIVAGDGLNDVPSLKEADVGIAMGLNSADLAKEVASVVLADNNICAVAESIRAGRRLYVNLFKAITFYLAAKIAIAFAFAICIAAGVGSPFHSTHLIIAEAFMDVGASLSFLFMPIDPSFALRGPHVYPVLFQVKFLGKIVAACAFGLFFTIIFSFMTGCNFDASRCRSGEGQERAQSAVFLGWMIVHVLAALVIAQIDSPITFRFSCNFRSMLSVFQDPVSRAGYRNWGLWTLTAVLFVFAAFVLPFVSTFLALTALSLGQIALVFLFVALGCLVVSTARVFFHQEWYLS
eukprot:ANDGO_01370.mRNA.1 Calcium-transporting ATPase